MTVQGQRDMYRDVRINTEHGGRRRNTPIKTAAVTAYVRGFAYRDPCRDCLREYIFDVCMQEGVTHGYKKVNARIQMEVCQV